MPRSRTPLIVVVEDDPPTLSMFRDMLVQAGYHPILMSRAKDAHLTIRQAQPDLVILDLWLEERESGEQLLGLLSREPTLQQVPVIVCSAYSEALDQHTAQRAAVVLRKPFVVDALLGALASCLGSSYAREV
jgi:twitching motility two-component system response regulator PilH